MGRFKATMAEIPKAGCGFQAQETWRQNIKMHALVLKLTKVRDADAIVDLLTQTDQVIHAYARNYRTSKKFPNSLELFSVYEMEFSRAGDGRYWLNSAYSEQVFSALTGDLVSFSCASAMLETIQVAHAEETPMPNLFRTVLQAFAAMEAAPEMAILVFAWVEARILYVQQILPEMKICAGCGKRIERSSYFQQEEGFLCNVCVHGEENVTPSVYAAICRLIETPMQEVLITAIRANDAEKRKRVLHEATRLLAQCLRDASSRRTLNAHAVMGESAFEDNNFLGTPVS